MHAKFDIFKKKIIHQALLHVKNDTHKSHHFWQIPVSPFNGHPSFLQIKGILASRRGYVS